MSVVFVKVDDIAVIIHWFHVNTSYKVFRFENNWESYNWNWFMFCEKPKEKMKCFISNKTIILTIELT